MRGCSIGDPDVITQRIPPRIEIAQIKKMNSRLTSKAKWKLYFACTQIQFPSVLRLFSTVLFEQTSLKTF